MTCLRILLLLASAAFSACWTHGGSPPLNATIPVTSLSTGNFPANNWAGITSPSTTVFTAGDGRKYIKGNPDVGGIIATGQNWRDQEVTTYISAGTIQLRSVSGGGLFFSTGVAAPNAVRIGILSSSTQFNTYVQDNASGCITNWPADGSHTFTFGVRGFDVYLKIDGVQAIDTCQTTAINPTGAITYKEYRPSAMGGGAPTVQPSSGVGARDIVFNYFQLTPLYSLYSSNTFDPRDFGMRSVGAVTGSMSTSSSTLNLSASADFRVGDTVIVEVGGESPAGYNTIGVGGVSPVLHYANSTARDADHSQANGTYAYLDTDGSVYSYSTGSSTWSAVNLGGTYYIGKKTALSLVARVTAVNASPATQLTLATSSAVAATNANVYLDSLPSFYPFTTSPEFNFANRTDGLSSYSSLSLSIPAGTWYFSNFAVASNAGGSGNERTGFTLFGQGVGSTTVQNPKGVPSQFLDTRINSSVTVRDFAYVGNMGDVGYGFATTGTNKQILDDYPVAMQGGTSSSNLLFKNLSCLNDMRGCVSIGGTNPQIQNSTATVTVGQRAYMQWQFQLVDCTGGAIDSVTTSGAFLLKSFEIFACNGATISNTTGTNALYAVNSATSSTISNPTTTIQANSFFDANSGAIDEPIFNINVNAFGSGNTGTLSNARAIQSGYIDGSNNSLKFIQIASVQTDWTISGQFPGGGGCSTTLGGFFQAPNYDAGSAEYGAMLVYSDAARTIVSGTRIKGAAIGTPGHSSHFGNISITGSSSQANNNVADVIQTGPSLSGNQTNAAYGGC